MLSLLKAYFSPDRKLYFSLRNIFGFMPGNVALYKLAFRHKSLAIKNLNGQRLSNERLEFLGDAILDAIIADFLFRRFPYRDEGFLTQMRSKIVSRNHLNKLSAKLGIDKLIQSTPEHAYYHKSIKGDAFEAFIGALYLDKGYKRTEKVLVDRILRLHVDLDELLFLETNYKSKLLEYAQQKKKTIEYTVVQETGNGYQKQYIVEVKIDNVPSGQGRDYSIKGAEQQAALKACELLQISLHNELAQGLAP